MNSLKTEEKLIHNKLKERKYKLNCKICLSIGCVHCVIETPTNKHDCDDCFDRQDFCICPKGNQHE